MNYELLITMHKLLKFYIQQNEENLVTYDEMVKNGASFEERVDFCKRTNPVVDNFYAVRPYYFMYRDNPTPELEKEIIEKFNGLIKEYLEKINEKDATKVEPKKEGTSKLEAEKEGEESPDENIKISEDEYKKAEAIFNKIMKGQSVKVSELNELDERVQFSIIYSVLMSFCGEDLTDPETETNMIFNLIKSDDSIVINRPNGITVNKSGDDISFSYNKKDEDKKNEDKKDGKSEELLKILKEKVAKLESKDTLSEKEKEFLEKLKEKIKELESSSPEKPAEKKEGKADFPEINDEANVYYYDQSDADTSSKGKKKSFGKRLANATKSAFNAIREGIKERREKTKLGYYETEDAEYVPVR